MENLRYKKIKSFILTVDGKSSSGKSTAAKLLSKKFAIPHLSSGLLYRWAAKKIIEMAGLGAVFSLPAVSSPDAETDNGQDGAEADQEQEVSPADGGIEMDLSTDSADDDIELNLPDTDTDTEPNLDFSEDTPTEDDFTMDFDEGEKGPDDSQVVDNKGESGENLQRGDDSGDSKSDDFEFKPGTFE